MLIISTPKGMTEVQGLVLDWLSSRRQEHTRGGRTTHYVVSAKSKGGILLWQGNFYDERDAWRFWSRLKAGHIGFEDYAAPTPYYDPSLRDLPFVQYDLATVTTFTASGTWNVPNAVISTDYLVAAGAGGGGGANGFGNGGGGGGGGLKNATGLSVTPLDAIAVTVGAGGAGGNATASPGNPSSLGALVTTTGGGDGGGPNAEGGAGGSGGGAGGGSVVNSGGAGVGGEGNNGANDSGGGAIPGGGGGKNAAGSGTTGGAGLTSSISGSSVTYSRGGDGNVGSPATKTANSGDGGDGSASGPGSAGASGVVIVSFSPLVPGFSLALMGM